AKEDTRYEDSNNKIPTMMNLLCVLCLTCNFTIDGLLQVVVPKPRNQPLARFSIWQDSANETVYQQALLDPNRVESSQAEIELHHEMQSLHRESQMGANLPNLAQFLAPSDLHPERGNQSCPANR